MFRRRTTSRRTYSFGRRFRPRARPPTRPKQWNRSNFFVNSDLSVANTSDTCVNSAVLLARHLNLGELSSPGRGYTDQIRSLDIGGVVLDYGMRRDAIYDATASATALTGFTGYTLATDRLDNTGAPVAAATTQWHRPQPPVAQISSTVPGATAENVDFPTKIHWRRWEKKPHYAVGVNETEGNLVAPEGQYLDARYPTLNKRLKTRLFAEHGLFFIFSFVTGPSWAAGGTLTYQFWLQGQIYWRLND